MPDLGNDRSTMPPYMGVKECNMEKFTDNWSFRLGAEDDGAIAERYILPTLVYSTNLHLKKHIAKDGTGRCFESMTLVWFKWRVRITRYAIVKETV